MNEDSITYGDLLPGDLIVAKRTSRYNPVTETLFIIQTTREGERSSVSITTFDATPYTHLPSPVVWTFSCGSPEAVLDVDDHGAVVIIRHDDVKKKP